MFPMIGIVASCVILYSILFYQRRLAKKMEGLMRDAGLLEVQVPLFKPAGRNWQDYIYDAFIESDLSGEHMEIVTAFRWTNRAIMLFGAMFLYSWYRVIRCFYG